MEIREIEESKRIKNTSLKSFGKSYEENNHEFINSVQKSETSECKVKNICINGSKTLDSKCTLISGREAIKNVYTSIKKSPKFPKRFRGLKNGKYKYSITNEDVLIELRNIEPGEWKKVYYDGYDENNRKISIHYFENKSKGIVFDVKIKNGWSNL